MIIVVMGVSGSGKSTVGRLLAQRLGVPYAEADEFHPASNIAKMSAGTPLTDEDRWPWLRSIASWISEREGGVVTCSALKRRYRDLLRGGGPVWFLHLHGSRSLLESRVNARAGHFMPPALLDSQLADLEPLEDDEPGVVVDIGGTLEEIVDISLRSLRGQPSG
jgi:gluconokinase